MILSNKVLVVHKNLFQMFFLGFESVFIRFEFFWANIYVKLFDFLISKIFDFWNCFSGGFQEACF